jgi:hypothetical protein
MTSQFWVYEPTILLKRDEIANLWPTVSMSANDKLNAITRLVLILTLLGFLVSKSNKIVITGVVTIASIVLLYFVQNTRNKGNKEGFTNPNVYKLLKNNYTEPTVSNPVMNVLLNQINDEPNRKPAAPAYNPAVEKEINEKTQKFVSENFADPNIDQRLFKDLGDSFNFDQSMRTWYATANTQIPNDQEGFAEYLYGDMPSCKEGDKFACLKGAPPRWTNI